VKCYVNRGKFSGRWFVYCDSKRHGYGALTRYVIASADTWSHALALAISHADQHWMNAHLSLIAEGLL